MWVTEPRRFRCMAWAQPLHPWVPTPCRDPSTKVPVGADPRALKRHRTGKPLQPPAILAHTNDPTSCISVNDSAVALEQWGLGVKRVVGVVRGGARDPCAGIPLRVQYRLTPNNRFWGLRGIETPHPSPMTPRQPELGPTGEPLGHNVVVGCRHPRRSFLPERVPRDSASSGRQSRPICQNTGQVGLGTTGENDKNTAFDSRRHVFCPIFEGQDLPLGPSPKCAILRPKATVSGPILGCSVPYFTGTFFQLSANEFSYVSGVIIVWLETCWALQKYTGHWDIIRMQSSIVII